MIVDTLFLIDLEREIADGDTGPALELLTRHHAQLMRISVITFGEPAEGYEDPAAPGLEEPIAPRGDIDDGHHLENARVQQTPFSIPSMVGDRQVYFLAGGIPGG